MQTMENNKNYYLFALSNFIAAIGGGMVLGKGVNIIDHPLLQGSSVLAFFLGTALGLVFFRIIPQKISLHLTKYFSIIAAFLSIILLFIFHDYSSQGKLTDNAGIIFFIFLSFRFSLWFFSRVLRAANAAGQQKIAWVELGYYGGMIGGLLMWNMFNISIGIAVALIIDASLQFIAGFIDLYVYQNVRKKEISLEEKTVLTPLSTLQKKWLWKLSISVVLLTIGTQVIIFSLAHEVESSLAIYILATYYGGVALAAYSCKVLNPTLHWITVLNQKTGCAAILFKNKKISISFAILTTAISVVVATLGITLWRWESSSLLRSYLLISIFIAAFLYEAISLCLLNRIGLEEKSASKSNMVIRTYGWMGIGAALSLWFIGLTQESIYSIAFALIICFSMPILFTRKRLIHDFWPL